MSDITLPRPSQIKNLLAPSDNGDAVNYGLIRRDYPPITPHFNIAGEMDVHVIENESLRVTQSITASITHPISGDGVTTFTIEGVNFSPRLPASIGQTVVITQVSSTIVDVSFIIPPLMAAIGTQAFQIRYFADYRANGIDQTESGTSFNNQITINPDWYAGPLATQPTMVSQLTRIGALVNGSGMTFNPPSGQIPYIFWPTSRISSISPGLRPSASSLSYYQPFRIDVMGRRRGSQDYAGDVVDGDHTLFRLDGMTGAGVPLPFYYRG